MSAAISVNDQFSHVGLVAYVSRPTWTTPERAQELAALLTDARWPWLPWWASFSGKHRRDDLKSIRVGGKNGSTPLLNGLLSEKLSMLYMNRARGDGNFTSVALNLNRDLENPTHETPYQLRVTCRSSQLPDGRQFSSFISLAHDLVQATGSVHAVMGAWPTFDWAICDSWTMRMVLDTSAGDKNLGLPERFGEQLAMASKWHLFFGRTYARHPRWGNYLNDTHLAAIGGVDRIRMEVAPALIQRVGQLTYVQLTSSIDTAMSAEAGAKRDRLEALMEPILPKPAPVQDA